MPRVTVVGGGLAGLVAALRLRQGGFDVTVYEASARVGGKAGAMVWPDRAGDPNDEHGYHIFPMWYRNIWSLVEELGIESHFQDCTDFLQLHAGEFPKFTIFRNITSWRYVWFNLTSGVLPVPEAFLFFYSALDLMSQLYRYREKLDQVTVTGFLRSRFYRTDLIADQFQELMLKGISVPTYEVSAMTMRNVMRFWVKSPEPMHRILKGSLQEQWIEPIRRRCEELGVRIETRHALRRIETQGGRVARLHLRDASGAPLTVEPETVLLAIPFGRVCELLDDSLFEAAPPLGQIRYLESRAMAAFNIYCKGRIPGMPHEHVNLLDSTYGISFIDVSQNWPGYEGTVLNAIASDYTALAGLSDVVATEHLMADLRRYFPMLTADGIDRIVFQSHADQPLFMNNVGGWAFRPEAKTAVSNLYLCGDYCRSAIDLVCMEGAVSTGLRAAEAIRGDLRVGDPIAVLKPFEYPTALLVLGRYALLPVAALAKLAALVSGQ